EVVRTKKEVVRTNFFLLTGILAQESISFERAWMSFERDVMFLGRETSYRKVVGTSLESFERAWLDRTKKEVVRTSRSNDFEARSNEL
ncbi:hypothetical protein GIB67_005684, partial [Kingdonia uniflora]